MSLKTFKKFSNSAHVVDYDRHLLVLTGGLNVRVTRKIRLSRHAEHSAHRKTSEPSGPGKLPKFARKWQKNTATTRFPEGSVQFNLAGSICVLSICPSFYSCSLFALEIHLDTSESFNEIQNVQFSLPAQSESIALVLDCLSLHFKLKADTQSEKFSETFLSTKLRLNCLLISSFNLF